MDLAQVRTEEAANAPASPRRDDTARNGSGKRIAERIGRLGSETAFAVSAEAAAFAAEGNTVYPFHLGDLNLPTPANVVEASFKAIRDGKTGYCPNGGIADATRGSRRRRERLARHLLWSRRTSRSNLVASR